MKTKIEITIEGIAKHVSFTEPQAKIVVNLLRGKKVTTINTYHSNGGDFVYLDDNIMSGDYYGAEKVGWKAFCGAMYAIKNAFGLKDESDVSKMFYVKLANEQF